MMYNTQVSNKLERLTTDDCNKIALIDAPSVSTDVGKYAKRNELAYYVLCNSWVLLIEEYSERQAIELEERLRSEGLIAQISAANNAADSLLSELEVTNIFRTISRSNCTLKIKLQLLRYPKRFSPLETDKLESESLDDFIAVDNAVKMGDRTEKSLYWTRKVREEVYALTSGYTPGAHRFSKGACSDCSPTLLQKLIACYTYDPSFNWGYAPSALRLGSYDLDWAKMPLVYGEKDKHEVMVAEVSAVAKSYKARRIIGPEQAYRQYQMSAVGSGLSDCLTRNARGRADLHDQRLNMDRCEYASLNGDYSTIDLTHASDCVSPALVRTVFPSEIVEDLFRWKATHMLVNGKPRLMHIFCTAGATITFPTETIVFLGIAQAVTSVVGLFTDEELLPPVVYGDDILCDTKATATLLEVLDMLGFRVNESKSFYGRDFLYRESCGVEWLNGEEVSSSYFPRKPITSGNVESVVALCSLQHRIYDHWRAQRFVLQVVRSIYPKMTSSAPGTECTDLWEDNPQYKVCYAPWDKKKCPTPPAVVREIHVSTKSVAAKVKGETSYKDPFTPANSDEVLAMYHYSRYLSDGPLYLSELDRLLGVSTSRLSYLDSDSEKTELTWSTTRS